MSDFWLKLRLKKRWGFVIYRTDYSSEADWNKFLTMHENFSNHGLPSSNFEDGRDAKSWKQMYWQNDKSQFDNATLAQLRQHFREWVAFQTFGGQLEWPETYMFMVVDKEVLDNIGPQNPEWDYSVRDEEPYLKAIDRDCPHENEDYPGWMKVPLVYLYRVYRKALNLESMRGLCLRDSDWFESETVSDEETYLEEDESDTSLGWGASPEAVETAHGT